MDGFANGLTKTNVPIDSSMSTCTLCGQKYLVGLHKSPHLVHNKHSLVSTGQSCEHGVWIGHGGDQQVAVAKAEDGTAFDYDLGVDNGLMDIKLSYPTDDEYKNLPVVWLMGDQAWDPHTLDSARMRSSFHGGHLRMAVTFPNYQSCTNGRNGCLSQEEYAHAVGDAEVFVDFHWTCLGWEHRGYLSQHLSQHEKPS